METLASVGSVYFCSTVHFVGADWLETQACGSDSSRFTVGLATTLAMTILTILTLCRLGDRLKSP